jgi:hypothetical protein
MGVRWTEEDLQRFQRSAVTPLAVKPKKSKYRNQPVIENGERYDSKLEMRCARWLELRKAIGEVLWYIRQVSFRLEGGVRYRADFLAALARGGVEVLDAKGFLNQTSKNKLKQMRERYGIDVKLWTDSHDEGGNYGE